MLDSIFKIYRTINPKEYFTENFKSVELSAVKILEIIASEELSDAYRGGDSYKKFKWQVEAAFILIAARLTVDFGGAGIHKAIRRLLTVRSRFAYMASGRLTDFYEQTLRLYIHLAGSKFTPDALATKLAEDVCCFDIETNSSADQYELIDGLLNKYVGKTLVPMPELGYLADASGVKDGKFYVDKKTGRPCKGITADTYSIAFGRYGDEGCGEAEVYLFDQVDTGILRMFSEYREAWAHNAGFDYQGIVNALVKSDKVNVFSDAGEIMVGKKRKRYLLSNGVFMRHRPSVVYYLTGGNKFYKASFMVYSPKAVMRAAIDEAAGYNGLPPYEIVEGAKYLSKTIIRDSYRILTGSLKSISEELGAVEGVEFSQNTKENFDYDTIYTPENKHLLNLDYIKEDIYRLYSLVRFIREQRFDRLTAKGNSVAYASALMFKQLYDDGGYQPHDNADFVKLSDATGLQLADICACYLNRDLSLYFPSADEIYISDAYDILRHANSGGLITIAEPFDDKPLSSDGMMAAADINSAYPAEMARSALPCGKPALKNWVGYSNQLIRAVKRGIKYFILKGYVEFKLNSDVVPVVSNKSTSGYDTITKRLRSFRGNIVLTSDEYLYLEQFGSINVRSSDRLFVYDVKTKAFAFLEELFLSRKADKLEGRAALAYAKKIIMNALYGALCQRRFDIDRRHVFDESGLSVYKYDTDPSQAAHLAAGAAITAKTRCKLAVYGNLLKKAGYRLMYTDTDALLFELHEKRLSQYAGKAHISQKCDSLIGKAKSILAKIGAPCGDDLGDFDVEYLMSDFEVFRPKTYQAIKWIKKKGKWLHAISKTACGIGFENNFTRWQVLSGKFIKGVMGKMRDGAGGKAMHYRLEVGEVSADAYDFAGRHNQLKGQAKHDFFMRWGHRWYNRRAGELLQARRKLLVDSS